MFQREAGGPQIDQPVEVSSRRRRLGEERCFFLGEDATGSPEPVHEFGFDVARHWATVSGVPIKGK